MFRTIPLFFVHVLKNGEANFLPVHSMFGIYTIYNKVVNGRFFYTTYHCNVFWDNYKTFFVENVRKLMELMEWI